MGLYTAHENTLYCLYILAKKSLAQNKAFTSTFTKL